MTFKHLQCCSKRLRLPVSGHPEPLLFVYFPLFFRLFRVLIHLSKRGILTFCPRFIAYNSFYDTLPECYRESLSIWNTPFRTEKTPNL